MGLTHIKAKVANPAKPRKTANLTLLVDSGAIYSVVPGETLRRLGIKSHSTQTFTLADGTEIKRRMGDAIFIINGKRRASLSYLVRRVTASCWAPSPWKPSASF